MSDFYDTEGNMTPRYRDGLLRTIETQTLDEIIQVYSNLLGNPLCRRELKNIIVLRTERERHNLVEELNELLAENTRLRGLIDDLTR